jgi:hypothetical protein
MNLLLDRRPVMVAPYPRTLANLQLAIQEVPHVWIFNNNDLRTPYRILAVCEDGQRT